MISSNNTNKLSPQELMPFSSTPIGCSNNTNKLSPQELTDPCFSWTTVQIIQINLVLKNTMPVTLGGLLFK